MEFKGGKINQIISDQEVNTNEIFANRYYGYFGMWYLLLDTFGHVENLLLVILFFTVWFSKDHI